MMQQINLKESLMKFGLSLFALVAFVSAQSNAAIEVGGIGGMSLASTSMSVPQGNAPSLDGRTGFAFGATAVLPFGEYFGLQPEILFMQKGSSDPLPQGAPAGTTTTSYNFGFLEFPVLAKGRFGSKTIRGTALFGPSLGLKTSASMSNGNQSGPITNANSIDFSLHLGAGVEANVAEKTILFLDGRYMLGLANMLDNPQNPNVSVKSRAFLILTGARFAI